VLVDGVPLPFDGIEFDAEMRRIDVVNDIAFTFMDLLAHGLPEFAWRFASGYAEHSGDYAGLALLRFFAVYRALVRARVALLRAEQVQGEDGAQAKAAAHDSIEQHLALAESLAEPAATRQPLLVLTSGVSGSGKSTVAQCLAQHLGAVRVRSDVERKRLFALAATTRPAPAELATLYGAEATQRTYARLGELARELLQAGVSVVVDAVALRRSERDALRSLAAECGARFSLVECRAPEAVLRARIERRLREANDASDADASVLVLQLGVREPAAADEAVLAFDTDCAMEELERRCEALAARLVHTPRATETPPP
jgi:predicted kinase